MSSERNITRSNESNLSSDSNARLISQSKSRLYKLLQDFEITDMTKFNKALIDTGAVIAGSAVMQSVLNVRWENSDIDIWLPVGGGQSIKNLGKAGPILQALPNTYFMPSIIKMCPRGANDSYIRYGDYARLKKFVSHVMTIKNFFNGSYSKIIQIMFVKTSIRDVISSFDFNESHMYYDGKNLVTKGNTISMLLKKKFHMSDIALEMQTLYEWIRTFKRIEKYENRGFKKINVIELVKVVKSIINFVKTNPSFDEYRLEDFVRAWSMNSCCFDKIMIDWKNNRLELRVVGTTRIYKSERRGDDISDHIDSSDHNDSSSDTHSGGVRPPHSGDTFLNPPAPIIRNVENMPQNCFDFTMYSDENIKKHISADKNNNIVIISPSGKKSTCFSRTELKQLLKDQDTVFYPCIGRDGYFPVDKQKTMVRIYSNDFNVVVPVTDVKTAISNTAASIFRIHETDEKYETTASSRTTHNMQDDAARVSADHCQQGSDKQLYRLLPHPITQGGSAQKNLKYQGKMYKVHTGDRGGKYIIVAKKKIYTTK